MIRVQGYNDFGVVIATKWRHYPRYLQPYFSVLGTVPSKSFTGAFSFNSRVDVRERSFYRVILGWSFYVFYGCNKHVQLSHLPTGILWNGPVRFGSTKWLGTTFERVRFWPVWSFRLVGPKCPKCILLTRTITKRAVAWVGSVQPECTFPLDTWTFRNFNPEFALNGKCSWSTE